MSVTDTFMRIFFPSQAAELELCRVHLSAVRVDYNCALAELKSARDDLKSLKEWEDKRYREAAARFEAYRAESQAELKVKSEALLKINDIRNSIVGLQRLDWSEHVYPLVASLDEAGVQGAGWPAAREVHRPVLVQLNEATVELARLKTELESARQSASEALVMSQTMRDLDVQHQRALDSLKVLHKQSARAKERIRSLRVGLIKIFHDEATSRKTQELARSVLSDDLDLVGNG